MQIGLAEHLRAWKTNDHINDSNYRFYSYSHVEGRRAHHSKHDHINNNDKGNDNDDSPFHRNVTF